MSGKQNHGESLGCGFNDQEREGVAACSEGIEKEQVRTIAILKSEEGCLTVYLHTGVRQNIACC